MLPVQSCNAGILNINHLVHVIHAIWEARTEWSSLGLQLGLTSVTLEAIGMAQHQSVKDCFLEMLSEWLRSGHKPSWKTLTSALIRSPSVRLHSLANLGKVIKKCTISLSLTHSLIPRPFHVFHC